MKRKRLDAAALVANWSVLVCAITISGSAASAAERIPMLPAVLNDESLDAVFEIGERPIWPKAPGHGLTRYRVSFIGISCQSHLIRFDERSDGSVYGEVKVWNRCHSIEPYTSHDFRLRSSQFAPVKAAMSKAGLWQRPASYWTNFDKDTICVDGINVTFERRDALDFRMDQSNVWCETTRDFVLAAQLLLIAAKDRPGLGLLPRIDHDR